MYNENFNNNMVTIINIMFSMNRTNPFIEIYLKQASNAEIHNTIWICNSNYNSTTTNNSISFNYDTVHADA